MAQTVFSPSDLKSLGFKPLDHSLIDSDALKITTNLQKAGHTSYLVGGCVRDLIMGKAPKDFDISTTARPRQVKRLIKNSYVIGKRFRLVLVKRGEIQYEVSTFRRSLLPGENPDSLPDGDNIFGSPKQDAVRRDYTCNALFYDPIKKEVIDYTGGLKDMRSGWVKLIGKPEDRLPEDPIRILRALRFSAKLGLQLDPRLKQGLEDFSEELKFSPLPRKREEYLKILKLWNPGQSFLQLQDLGALQHLLGEAHQLILKPQAKRCFAQQLNFFEKHIRRDLEPAFSFGLFLWSLALSSQPELSYEELFQWIKQDSIQSLAKHELGAFNTELTQIEQAFRIMPELLDFEGFSRRGARRQHGLVTQKAFPLALLFYMQDHGSYASDWLEFYAGYQPSEELLFSKSGEMSSLKKES